MISNVPLTLLPAASVAVQDTVVALWEVVTITGGPHSSMRSPRIALDWAREQIQSYGRDNPWVMVDVLGEFSPSSINALLGVEEVNRAMLRRWPDTSWAVAQKPIGVDVARIGDDGSVIFARQGRMSWAPVVLRVERTITIAARVARNAAKWQTDMVYVDDSGHWGHGVIDALATGGFPAQGVLNEGEGQPSAVSEHPERDPDANG